MERYRLTIPLRAFASKLVCVLTLILLPVCASATEAAGGLDAGAPDALPASAQDRIAHPGDSRPTIATWIRGLLSIGAVVPSQSPKDEAGPASPRPATARSSQVSSARSLPASEVRLWGAIIPVALLAAGSLVRRARAKTWNPPLFQAWIGHDPVGRSRAAGKVVSVQPSAPELDETLLGGLAAAALEGVLILDDVGTVMHANALAARILGEDDPEQLRGVDLSHWAGEKSPRSRPGSRRIGRPWSAGGPHAGGVWHIESARKGGEPFTAEVSISPIRVGGRWRAIAILREITENAIGDNPDGFQRIVEESRTGILVLDPRGTPLYTNTAAKGFLQVGATPLREPPLGSPEPSSERREVTIQRSDGSRGVAALSIRATKWQGQSAFLAILDDVTERKASEESMCRLAFEDTLTNLPNRCRFLERLRRITRPGQDHEEPFALLFMDLDRFKTINDTLGHGVGDDLLAAVASRLSNVLRGADCVARMGGDEFTAIISGVRTAAEIEAVVRKFQAAFRDPFAFQDRTLYTSASIGVALYPKDGRDPDLLLRHADTAMYDAKSRGAGLFSLYQPSMSLETQARLDMESELHDALSRDELVLHYQPQVRLADGAIIGAEALLRWQHPRRGLLAPALFVPLLEETGLIIEVGEWVLERACARAQQWERTAGRLIPVSVNVSPIQVERGDLAESIQRLMTERGLQRGMLRLELAETAMFRNMERSVELLNQLVALGVHLAIDDFGTGHGSLAMVRRLPVSTIKLDGEFVRGVASQRADQALAEATIAMAHGLGKTVVAEGVETSEQMRVLLELGCDAAQGRYFGGPVPPEEMEL